MPAMDDGKVLRMFRSRLSGLSGLVLYMPDDPVVDAPDNAHAATLSLANRYTRPRHSASDSVFCDVVLRVDVEVQPEAFETDGADALDNILGAIAARLDHYAEQSGGTHVKVVTHERDRASTGDLSEHATGYVLARCVVQETTSTGPTIPSVS